MAEIRALIVDDEPLARRGIRQLLAAYPDVAVVGECRDGREALRALDALAPDLVFLDIQMPDLDGFAVLRARGPERMPAVVFVTAHDEFAVRAFEECALDYVVKPVSEARFQATMARVRERMRVEGALELVSRLTRLLAGETSGARLALPTRTGTVLIDCNDIDWVQARDYCAAIHAGKRLYLVRQSLAALERRLDPARFLRVHRGAIVRLDQVAELRGKEAGDGIAILRDGTRVPVSRRRRIRLAALLRARAR